MKLLCLFLAAATVVQARDIHLQQVVGGVSGSGTTTRYWDCCKPSCAWKENVETASPVASCAADGVTTVDPSTRSGCDSDGSSYTCNNQQPWVVNSTFAFGFAAASFTGGADNSQCCICVQLSFLSTITEKTLVVQVTNTGADLGSNHFDIQLPGGGVGYFTTGCSSQWNCPANGWGSQYGGITSDSECSELPEVLQPGCHFRFNWFQNADNPNVNFQQVVCPSELTSITGCA
ncbi:endoglucanase-like [Sitophilus oryzae]|uniref:Cellulase n=1 Tax=Sitophilus oryzae TaxID=7048 RepID=E7CIN5_SITOR|nr:endoglucanase-like [Sitophilus oryzae]ADU33247.1 endo-beta-1,4-glucanase [Sitophilus oryzae]